MTYPIVGEAAQASAQPRTSMDKMIDTLLAPRAGETAIDGAEEPAPAARAAPAAPVTEAMHAAIDAATPEAAAVEPEPPKPARTADSGRLAKALVDLERSQGAVLKMERRIKDFEAQLSEAALDPTKALALGKHDPDALIAAMLDGKVKKPAEPERTADQMALDAVTAEVAELRQERADHLAKQAFHGEINAINEKLKDRPISGVYPWAAEQIYKNFYAEHERTNQVPDLDDVIEKFEAGVAGDLRLALSNERTFQKLISDPKLREMVVKALGLPTTETRQPAQQDTPRANALTDGPSVISARMAADIPERRVSEIRPRAQRDERTLDILLASKGKKQ